MKKKHILVVDDERPLAHALKTKMEAAGFRVSVAFNGADAITACKDTNYDLILLDLLMPQTDGWAVLETLQGNNAKIIITSNLEQKEDIERAKKLGALDFLVKSDVSLSDIVDKVLSVKP